MPLSEPAKNKQKCYPSGIYKVADITWTVMVMSMELIKMRRRRRIRMTSRMRMRRITIPSKLDLTTGTFKYAPKYTQIRQLRYLEPVFECAKYGQVGYP